MTLKNIDFSVDMYGTTAISASTYQVVYTGDEASANVRFTVTDEPDLTGATAKAHFYFADSHHIERDLTLDGLVFNYTLVGTENDHAGIVRTDIMITLGGATFTRAGYKFRVDTSLEASAPLVDYAVDTLDKLVDTTEDWLLQAQSDFGTAQAQRADEWVTDNDTRDDAFDAAQSSRATTFNESEAARTSTFNTNETSRSNTFTINENAREAAAEANQAQAATDHATAVADNATAIADSSRAASDHATATTDHNTAVTDHSTASADHAMALADQEIVDGLQDQFDAVIANATVDSEVINARQGSATLSQNLLSIKSELADIELNKANLADLPSSAYTFKGSTTFAALPTTGNTLGDTYYVTDGTPQNYAWTGTAWTPIGNGAFADGSVITKKLADVAVTAQKVDSSNVSPNLFANPVTGKYFSAPIGETAAQKTSANWNGTDTLIPVNAGDIVRFNKAYQNGYFVGVDAGGIVRQLGAVKSPVNYSEVVVAANVVGFYSAAYITYASEFMVTVNKPMPNVYLTPTTIVRKLDWLKVEEDNLSAELVTKVNAISSRWFGKTFISLGDSITWQDGKAYANASYPANNGQIARGYQTHLKERLGFLSYNNLGVSGRPMADGTANGVGTVTTGLEVADYSIYNLATIASGTNDFKLNVPLGTIGTIGSTFDRTTFIGAYQTLIEYIINNSKNTRIVLFTPLQRNNNLYDIYKVNTAGHKLSDYRNAILALKELYSLPVCDLYTMSGINMLNLATFFMDGLHPHDGGYAFYSGYVVDTVDAVAPIFI